MRSQRSPHCEPDRLYKMGSDIGQERRNETRPVTRFGSGFLNPTMPSTLSSPRYDSQGINCKQRIISSLAFSLFVHFNERYIFLKEIRRCVYILCEIDVLILMKNLNIH